MVVLVEIGGSSIQCGDMILTELGLQGLMCNSLICQSVLLSGGAAADVCSLCPPGTYSTSSGRVWFDARGFSSLALLSYVQGRFCTDR